MEAGRGTEGVAKYIGVYSQCMDAFREDCDRRAVEWGAWDAGGAQASKEFVDEGGSQIVEAYR